MLLGQVVPAINRLLVAASISLVASVITTGIVPAINRLLVAASISLVANVIRTGSTSH
jgi:hypothetical protein